MSISIEQPPESMDEEVRAWVNRLMIQVAGVLEQQDESIQSLEERVKRLESTIKPLLGYPKFDGGDKSITLASHWIPTSDFKISFKTTIDSIVAHQQAFIAGDETMGNTIVVDCRKDGKIRFYAYVNNSVVSIISSANTFADGIEHEVVAQFINGTATLLVDGNNEGSRKWTLDGKQYVSMFGAKGLIINRSISAVLHDVKLEDLTNEQNTLEYLLNDGPDGNPVALEKSGGPSATYNGFGDSDFV